MSMKHLTEWASEPGPGVKVLIAEGIRLAMKPDVTPEQKPRRMMGNPYCPPPNYHAHGHSEIGDCTRPGFPPCQPVDDCQHEPLPPYVRHPVFDKDAPPGSLATG